MTPSELSQVRSVAPVLLAALAQGLTLGWGSPAVGKLRAGEGPFTPTIDEISWIVSFFSLGILAGSLGGSAVFARVGRRATLMLGPVLLSACSALLFLAPSAQPLYLARLLGGAGHGVGVSFASIYVAEVTDAVLRGRLILMVNLLIMTGPLLSYALAPHLSYGVLSLGPLATASAALVLALGLGWMRETPLYLSSKGRADEALATLRAFTQQIVEEVGAPLSASVCSVLVVAANIAAVLGSMPVVDRLGRRTILAGSAYGNAAAMAALAGFLAARDWLGADVSGVAWLPLASLLAFNVATGMGIITIPHVLTSELLPQRAKASVAPLAGALIAVSSFAIHKSFFPVGRALGFAAPFAFFAVYNFGYATFVVANVPETKGKTLAQVQEMLAVGVADAKKKK